MTHPVYPGGPDCQPNCPGPWSTYHDGYADGYENAQAAPPDGLREALTHIERLLNSPGGLTERSQDEERYIYAEARAFLKRAALAAPAGGPHGTHTPCCGWPSEHKWADPIRCMKDHEDWPCKAALAASPSAPKVCADCGEEFTGTWHDSNAKVLFRPDHPFRPASPSAAPLDVERLALAIEAVRKSKDSYTADAGRGPQRYWRKVPFTAAAIAAAYSEEGAG